MYRRQHQAGAAPFTPNVVRPEGEITRTFPSWPTPPAPVAEPNAQRGMPWPDTGIAKAAGAPETRRMPYPGQIDPHGVFAPAQPGVTGARRWRAATESFRADRSAQRRCCGRRTLAWRPAFDVGARSQRALRRQKPPPRQRRSRNRSKVRVTAPSPSARCPARWIRKHRCQRRGVQRLDDQPGRRFLASFRVDKIGLPS